MCKSACAACIIRHPSEQFSPTAVRALYKAQVPQSNHQNITSHLLSRMLIHFNLLCISIVYVLARRKPTAVLTMAHKQSQTQLPERNCMQMPVGHCETICWSSFQQDQDDSTHEAFLAALLLDLWGLWFVASPFSETEDFSRLSKTNSRTVSPINQSKHCQRLGPQTQATWSKPTLELSSNQPRVAISLGSHRLHVQGFGLLELLELLEWFQWNLVLASAHGALNAFEVVLFHLLSAPGLASRDLWRPVHKNAN